MAVPEARSAASAGGSGLDHRLHPLLSVPYRDYRTALRERLHGLYERRAALEVEIGHAEAALEVSQCGDRRRWGLSVASFLVVALFVGAVAIGLVRNLMPSPRGCSPWGYTRTEAQNIVSALQLYWMDYPDGPCPTSETLKGEYLDQSKALVDAWGQRFLLLCAQETSVVISAGADGEYGTEDDMRWEVWTGPP